MYANIYESRLFSYGWMFWALLNNQIFSCSFTFQDKYDRKRKEKAKTEAEKLLHSWQKQEQRRGQGGQKHHPEAKPDQGEVQQQTPRAFRHGSGKETKNRIFPNLLFLPLLRPQPQSSSSFLMINCIRSTRRQVIRERRGSTPCTAECVWLESEKLNCSTRMQICCRFTSAALYRFLGVENSACISESTPTWKW